jgi:hypothetical protein
MSPAFSGLPAGSVVNWPNFRPHNSKGVVKKYVLPKTLATEFLSNVRLKGPKTFFSSFF